MLRVVKDDLISVLVYILWPGLLFDSGYPGLLTRQVDAVGNSVLHWAVQNNNHVMVDMLLRAERHQRQSLSINAIARPELMGQRNQAGETPLDLAVRLTRFECVHMLCDHNTDRRNNDGPDYCTSKMHRLTRDPSKAIPYEMILAMCKLDPRLTPTATKNLYCAVRNGTMYRDVTYSQTLWNIFTSSPLGIHDHMKHGTPDFVYRQSQRLRTMNPTCDAIETVSFLCVLWRSCEFEAAVEALPISILGPGSRPKTILNSLIARGHTRMAYFLLKKHNERLNVAEANTVTHDTALLCVQHGRDLLFNRIVALCPLTSAPRLATINWQSYGTVCTFRHILGHLVLSECRSTLEIITLASELAVLCLSYSDRHPEHFSMLYHLLDHYRTVLPGLAATTQNVISDHPLAKEITTRADKAVYRLLGLYELRQTQQRRAVNPDHTATIFRQHVRGCRTYPDQVVCVAGCDEYEWYLSDPMDITQAEQDFFSYRLLQEQHQNSAGPILSRIMLGCPTGPILIIVGYLGPTVLNLFKRSKTSVGLTY
jgi:hypothetical protein